MKKKKQILLKIFNKIILQKFEKEYDEMNKYGINNEIINNNFYQNLVNRLLRIVTRINQTNFSKAFGWKFKLFSNISK